MTNRTNLFNKSTASIRSPVRDFCGAFVAIDTLFHNCSFGGLQQRLAKNFVADNVQRTADSLRLQYGQYFQPGECSLACTDSPSDDKYPVSLQYLHSQISDCACCVLLTGDSIFCPAPPPIQRCFPYQFSRRIFADSNATRHDIRYSARIKSGVFDTFSRLILLIAARISSDKDILFLSWPGLQ